MKGTKRTVVYLISLLIILGFWMIPAPAGMSASGMQVLGILLGVLLLWLTESIDWPSYLCLAGLTLVPELKMGSILSSSFGNSTFAFLLFTFMCTYAVGQTSFVKRCAIGFITNRLASKGSWWFITIYCLSVLLIGMVMSPVVLFVIYMPILNSVCSELKLEKSDKLANTLILGTLFSCAISCGMTPISHTFPVMALGFYNQMSGSTISYAHYMAEAIPVGLISFVAMLAIFRFILRPDTAKLRELNAENLKVDLKPMEKREKWIVGIFFAVVVAWVMPEFLKGVLPGVASFFSARGTTFPPMIGAIAMFMISIDGKPLLNFKEAMSKGVQWGGLVMAAATLAIGSAMTNADIGLTAWLSGAIEPVLTGLNPVLIVLVFAVWTYIMTNACSNMVTVTVVCAVALPICLASGGALNAASMAAMIGMGASYAFVLPPAHPNVALAIGTGWTNTSQVVKYGLPLMVIALLAAAFVGYPIGSALMLY